uniref:(northern house mosquito) hypothetical protein n=1 Tax=Culex pipiens TaxID=7175 RepID=A0A8D8CB06_CULPI
MLGPQKKTKTQQSHGIGFQPLMEKCPKKPLLVDLTVEICTLPGLITKVMWYLESCTRRPEAATSRGEARNIARQTTKFCVTQRENSSILLVVPFPTMLTLVDIPQLTMNLTISEE